MNRDLSNVTWKKSSWSSGNGQCTECARLPDGSTAVRHSKQPDGPVLIFTPDEWRAFTEGVKLHEFD